MRSLITILFLSLIAPVFGQSKKKWNTLETEYNALKYRYDSIQHVHDSVSSILTGRKNNETITTLNQLNTDYGDYLLSVLSKMNVLQQLKDTTTFRFNDSILVKESFDLGTWKQGIFRELRLSSDLSEYRLTVIKDTLSSYPKRSKEKYAYLENLTYQYVDLLSFNVAQLEELQKMNILAQKCIESAVKLNKELQPRIQLLEAETVRLKSRISELEANYRKKGPKGFPAVYAEVFPHVFPELQVQELQYVSLNEPIDGAVVLEDRVGEEIFQIVDEEAEFPGGPGEMMKWIQKNIKYPENYDGFSMRTTLQFVVYVDGHIGNVTMMRGFEDCPVCRENYISIIRSMPNWKPGKIHGKPVSMYYNLPIKIDPG